MDLKIDSRNVGMTPRWKQEIQDRITTLQTEYDNITHARITLTKNPHHKKGDDNAEALIVLNLPPRHTVTARKEAKSFEEAIRSAFKAATTEIKKFREKPVSQKSVKTRGTLTRPRSNDRRVCGKRPAGFQGSGKNGALRHVTR